PRAADDPTLARLLQSGQAGGEAVRAPERAERKVERRTGSGSEAGSERRRQREVGQERRPARRADGGLTAGPESPLDAEAAREVLGRLDDARFDEDLRAGDVEVADERLGIAQPVGKIADQQRVRAIVAGDAAPLREHTTYLLRERI